MTPLNTTCLAPPQRHRRPTVLMPAGACDSHSHVTPSGPWSLVADASYTPAQASIQAAACMRSSLGFERGVVVQASPFGTDNSGVLQALAEGHGHLRGVIVSESIADEEIERLHRAGVRGMRFITSGLGGTVGTQAMVRLAPRIAPFGWHIEVLPAADQWESLFPILQNLPTTVVIDHMGGLSAHVGIDDPAVLRIRRLVRDRGAYVKLVGYRLSSDLMDVRLIERARVLYHEAPDRMVWGTDWPHVAVSPMPDAADLLDAFANWFDQDQAVMKTILADNPGQLFNFEAVA